MFLKSFLELTTGYTGVFRENSFAVFL